MNVSQNKSNPLVMSLAPKLNEIVAANDVPINEMPPKNKLAIKVDTKPKDDTEKEELEEYFQSETDTDDEPSGRVRWHSCQPQIDAEKENRNPDQVLDADVFAKLSPLRCTPCRLPLDSSPKAVPVKTRSYLQ